MVNHRRALVPGATYFFTVTLPDRRKDWLIAHVDLLRAVVRGVRRKRPFKIDAIVVLPDHLHAVWTLREDDADYPGRWRAIKAGFTRALKCHGVPLVRSRRGECDLWQRRYWEHLIRDDGDFARHIDYIHYNPVKHGLVLIRSTGDGHRSMLSRDGASSALIGGAVIRTDRSATDGRSRIALRFIRATLATLA